MKKIALFYSLFLFLSFNALAQPDGDVWTLQECVDYALNNNLDIRQSMIDVQGSDYNRQQSKYAMLPNLNGRSSFQSNWGRSIDPTTNDFLTRQISFLSFGASSSVTLFNSGTIRNQWKQREQEYQASQFDFENAKNNVILTLVGMYMNVIYNRELFENAQAQLNSTTRQVERTKKQVDAGALPISNLLELQAQQATNELNVINQENALNFSRLQLKQILQLPSTRVLQVVIPELEIEQSLLQEISLEEIYRTSLENMPDIKAAEFRTKAAEFGIKSSRGQLYPSISASAGLNTNYSSAFSEFSPLKTQLNDNISWFSGLSLSIPVFNGFNASLNVQRALVNKSRTDIQLEQVKNSLRQSIETAYNDALAAIKTYASAEKQVSAREESFRVTEQRYNLGASDFVQYQVAENDLFGAKSDLLRAKFDLIFKKKILDFYQGKSLEL